MSFYEEQRYIKMMKDTVVEIYGLEDRHTIDFFFKCEYMSFNSLVGLFYTLTGVPA